VSIVLRVIPDHNKSVEQLGLPPVIEKIAEERRGLILVTGATGSGKSTTLASMIDCINSTRSGHIVTIASASGYIGVARLADYAASKWAAVGFDESLRAELRKVAPGVLTTVVCPFYINTGMFRGVRSRFPWLLPILEEDDVAERVVRAIRNGTRRVVLPWPVQMLPLLRVLPVGVFDWIANFLGVNTSMDEFVGRGGGKS